MDLEAGKSSGMRAIHDRPRPEPGQENVEELQRAHAEAEAVESNPHPGIEVQDTEGQEELQGPSVADTRRIDLRTPIVLSAHQVYRMYLECFFPEEVNDEVRVTPEPIIHEQVIYAHISHIPQEWNEGDLKDLVKRHTPLLVGNSGDEGDGLWMNVDGSDDYGPSGG